MNKLLTLCGVFLSVYAFAKDPMPISNSTMTDMNANNPVSNVNPLTEKWMSIRGVPAFDKVKVADLRELWKRRWQKILHKLIRSQTIQSLQVLKIRLLPWKKRDKLRKSTNHLWSMEFNDERCQISGSRN